MKLEKNELNTIVTTTIGYSILEFWGDWCRQFAVWFDNENTTKEPDRDWALILIHLSLCLFRQRFVLSYVERKKVLWFFCKNLQQTYQTNSHRIHVLKHRSSIRPKLSRLSWKKYIIILQSIDWIWRYTNSSMQIYVPDPRSVQNPTTVTM